MRQTIKKEPSEHFNNYKGLHFNDPKDCHFIDSETGAHFEYSDLCNRLALLNKDKSLKKLMNQTVRSTSNDKNKLLQEFSNFHPKTNNFNLMRNDKKLNTNYKAQVQKPIKNVCITLSGLNKMSKPATSSAAKKCVPHMLKSINSVSGSGLKLLSPQHKNHLSEFSGFNFKSLDNRKSVDVTNPNKMNCFLFSKSPSQKYANALFSKNMALSPTNKKR